MMRWLPWIIILLLVLAALLANWLMNLTMM